MTNVERMKELLEESIEPGVFGRWVPMDQGMTDHDWVALSILCEKYGYGAIMSQVSYMWKSLDPGGNHTVAAAAVVRDKYIDKVEA